MSSPTLRMLVYLTAIVTFSPVSQAAPPGGEQKLELVVQSGHSRFLSDVCWSPDGRRILTTSGDKTAVLWDSGTGDVLRIFSGHLEAIKEASFSPDGKKILSASQDKSAILWDVETGEKLLVLKHDFECDTARFSPDGKWIVTASFVAHVWDALTGKKILTLDKTNARCASFSPDGTRILIGLPVHGNANIIICDSGTGKILRTVNSRQDTVWGIDLCQDGKVLATSSFDRTVSVWDTALEKKLLTLPAEAHRGMRARISTDGKQLVTPVTDHSDIWNIATGEKIRTFKSSKGDVVAASFSPDGKRVATACRDRLTEVWDTATGRLVLTLDGQTHMAMSAPLAGGNLLAVASMDSSAAIWDLGKGEPLSVLNGHSSYVGLINLSPDGKKAITVSGDNLGIVWNAVKGTKLFSFTNEKRLTSAAFSPDGRHILTAGSDYMVVIRDAETGEKIRSISSHSNAAYSPDGKRIVTSDVFHRTVFVWDAATGKKVFEVTPTVLVENPSRSNFPTKSQFSPDGKSLITACTDRIAVLWDAATGERLQTLSGHEDSVECVGFSPDGKLVVTGSEDNSVKIWNTATGENFRTLTGHTSRVTSAAFDKDAKRVITSSWDGTTRLWDVTTGRELAMLLFINSSRDWLVVTPDGYFDGSENGTKALGLRVAGTNEFVALERYRKQFERSGLLAKIWAGENYLGTKAVSQDLPPKIRVLSPDVCHESKDGKLRIEAEAMSQGEYPVTQFRLMVNGRPHTTKFGLIDVAEPTLGKATAKWDIELEPGRHTIEVIAYTKAVFGKSDAVEVKYVGTDASGVDLPTLYILAIGVSKYPVQPLDYAHRDAQEVAKAFQVHSKPLFKKIETKVLTDETATRDGILDGLDWLRKNMTQKDFGIFFFAGHGVKDSRDTVYFMPVDGDREKLTRTAIDGDVLQKELTSTVGQLLVILDACHSGAVGGNKSRGLSDNLLKDLSSEEKGIAIMCSASGREEAGESREHQHGKFTVALLEGIRGKGDGKDSKISLSDGAVYFKKLDSYVTDRVKVLSKGEQHPVTCIPRNFRDFPLSKP